MVSHEGLRPEHVTPPFLSLCKVAVSHFKNSADREHAIFLAARGQRLEPQIDEDRAVLAILMADKVDLSRFRAAPSARLSPLSLESDRAFPTQGRVASPRIVEAVDVFEDCHLGPSARFP